MILPISLFFPTYFSLVSRYYDYELKSHDSHFIDLSNGTMDAMIAWNHKPEFNITITVNQSFIKTFKEESALIVSGNNVSIFADNPNLNYKLHVWIFPHDTCRSESILYSTNLFLNNIFSVKDHYDSLCIFFANHNPKMNFAITVTGKSKTSIYVLNSNDEKKMLCKKKKCNFNANDHFFIQINDINQNDIVGMNYLLKERENLTIQCDHTQIPYFNNLIRKDSIFDKMVMKCNEDEIEDLHYKKYLIFLIVFIILLFICILFVCNFTRTLKHLDNRRNVRFSIPKDKESNDEEKIEIDELINL